jgi:non-ribosomal peptide synthase protein (TIGR01720 family)
VLGIDVSRTVGRLSTFTPLLVEAPAFDDPAAVLTSVVDQIRDHPNHGIGHGLLRFMGDPETQRALADMPPPPINVNYWGQTNEYLEQAIMPFDESPGPLYAASGRRPRLLDVFGLVVGSQFSIVWSYSRNLHRQETIAALAEDAARELLWLAGVDPADADVTAEPLEKSVLHKTAQG